MPEEKYWTPFPDTNPEFQVPESALADKYMVGGGDIESAKRQLLLNEQLFPGSYPGEAIENQIKYWRTNYINPNIKTMKTKDGNPLLGVTKESYLAMPYKDRIKIDQAANDQGFMATVNGEWDVATETAIQAANNKSSNNAAPQTGTQTQTKQPAAINTIARPKLDPNTNPIMQYLRTIRPEYDVDKEKRLKNLAIINAVGGLLTSALNVRGVSNNFKGGGYGSVIRPSQDKTMDYIGGSLKEMKDNRDKLQEQYKMLNLQELIRQQGINEAYNMADYQAGIRAEETKKAQDFSAGQQAKSETFTAGENEKNRAFQLEKQQKDISIEKELAKYKSGLAKDLLDAQQAKEIAVDTERYKLMGEMYDKKLKAVLNKEAQKYARDEYKDGLVLTKPDGTPYSRPLRNNELATVYTIIEKAYPEEAKMNLLMMDSKFNAETKMKVLISTYMYDPEIRKAVEKILGSPPTYENPFPQGIYNELTGQDTTARRPSLFPE